MLKEDPQWRRFLEYCIGEGGYTGCEPPAMGDTELASVEEELEDALAELDLDEDDSEAEQKEWVRPDDR